MKGVCSWWISVTIVRESKPTGEFRTKGRLVALTVDQLVALPDLATRVVSGRGGLDRSIGWAHVCELPDPWSWIGSGDLLMTTGLGVPGSPAEQVRYVESLAAAGVAAVAVGEDMHAPPLTAKMVAASDSLGLPLLLTRRDIPFIALARSVATASQREELARIDQTVRVYELLRQSSLHEMRLGELLGSLEQVLGARLVAADAVTGRPLVPGTVVPGGLLAEVGRGGNRARDELPVVLQSDAGDSLGVLVPGPRPVLLVATVVDGTVPDLTVLRHAAAVTALQQTWVFAERERARRLGATLLAQLVDDQIDGTLAHSHLAERGLAGRTLVVAACARAEVDAHEELHHLHHVLGDAGVEHVMLYRRGTTYVLLPADREALGQLYGGLPAGWAAGISDTLEDPLLVGAAHREAGWALSRARERGLPVVRHSDDLTDSMFLPGRREDGVEAARRVLGMILDYDEEHGTQLTRSLQAFLEENRSWQRAAARLHVHKQTLVYRMSRVEELSGRSLSSTADVAELWLALRSAVETALLDL